MGLDLSGNGSSGTIVYMMREMETAALCLSVVSTEYYVAVMMFDFEGTST